MIRILIKPCERREEQSALSRELLFSALLDKFSLPKAEIKKTDKGKPFFEEEGYPAFSISHTAGAVAVAICDECESIGVDIEKCAPRRSLQRLTDRFFPGLNHSESEILDIDFITDADIADAKKGFSEVLFTLGEAIIKCDGRGFSVSGEAALLSQKMKKSSFILTLGGEKYALSVAVKREEG